MKTKRDAVEYFREWINGDNVGTLLAYSPPGGSVVEFLEERVVKTDEMPEDVRDHFIAFMDGMGIDRGEVFRNKAGRPDRVKFPRSVG